MEAAHGFVTDASTSDGAIDAARESGTVEVAINGRFLGRPISGVERVAIELLGGLDRRLQSDGGLWVAPSGRRFAFRLLVPPGSGPPSSLKWIERVTVGRRSGHAWEQLDLAKATRGTFLVNLCNTAPIAKRDQLVFLHDAGVFRTPNAYRPAFRWWYRVLFVVVTRRAAALATNSDFSRAELAAACRVLAERFAVVPLGHEHALAAEPDHSVFARHGIPADGYVLAVSSHNPNKNFSMLLQAVELLGDRADPPPVVVAGRTNPRVFSPEDQERTRAHFIGPVTDAELAALYEGAACLAYPSLYEGFGLPLIEAMTRGCPVVTSRVAAMPETCDDAAVYCDPDDAQSIAASIIRVLSEPDLAPALVIAGRERAQTFRWERSLDVLLDVIDRAVVG